MENLGRHRHVQYTEDSSALVADPLFRKQTILAEDMMEVEMNKKRVCWYLPLQIGYFVYQYAKLRMLEFYYDCLLQYIAKEDFELCEMDTDSLYFAVSKPCLDDVIQDKPGFYRAFREWFPSPACDEHYNSFVASKCLGETWSPHHPCCVQRLKDDKRTPGLFKLEYEGDGIVGLCSKTYICFSQDNSENKLAMKGLNKNLNPFNKDRYLDVLKSRQSGKGTNIGFRSDGTKMLTYNQERAALPYLYIKRKVREDGVTTTPLDI